MPTAKRKNALAFFSRCRADALRRINMHVNLTAYNDVENLSRFTPESFKNYCEKKLADCDKHIAFIKRNCAKSNWGGRVCEIGSGNGKLLYRLEKEKLLSLGVGYEISRSRCAFAKKFKDYVKSSKTDIRNKNILEEKPLENMDLVIGVDIVFQLIGPLHGKAEDKLLKWSAASLKKGGCLVFELMGFEHFKKFIDLSEDGIFRAWEEFPPHDPFQFVLAKISQNKQGDIVWDKLFLKRNSMEKSTFTNVLRPYSRKEITKKLESYGFKCRIFPYWKKKDDTDQTGYLVMAKKV